MTKLFYLAVNQRCHPDDIPVITMAFFIECGIGRNVFVECNVWEFKIGLKM